MSHIDVHISSGLHACIYRYEDVSCNSNSRKRAKKNPRAQIDHMPHNNIRTGKIHPLFNILSLLEQYGNHHQNFAPERFTYQRGFLRRNCTIAEFAVFVKSPRESANFQTSSAATTMKQNYENTPLVWRNFK